MGQSFARFRISRKVALASLSTTLTAVLFLSNSVAGAAVPNSTVKVVGLSSAEGKVSSVSNKYNATEFTTLEANTADGAVYIALGTPTTKVSNTAVQLQVFTVAGSNATTSNLAGPAVITIRTSSAITRWTTVAGSTKPTGTSLGKAYVNLAAAAVKPVTGSVSVAITVKGKATVTTTYNYSVKIVSGNGTSNGSKFQVNLSGSGANASTSKTFTIGSIV